eukprot:g4683.t1
MQATLYAGAPANGTSFRVFFNAGGVGQRVYWQWPATGASRMLTLMREAPGVPPMKIKQDPLPEAPAPLATGDTPTLVQAVNVTLYRRGTFHLLFVGADAVAAAARQPDAYVEHASFDIDCTRFQVAGSEPVTARAGAEVAGGGRVGAFTVDRREPLVAPSSPPRPPQRVLAPCGPRASNSSWCFNQVIPGAVLALNGTYYVYVAGQDWDGSDGGGRARIGVATGPSLSQLVLHPVPLLEGVAGEWDERSVFPNGAVETPGGGVALTYMGQAMDDSWGGIGLATAKTPLGPFTRHGAPVLPTSPGQDPIHEHTLNRLPNGSFALFYAGFSPATGDQGFLAVSEDLRSWRPFAGNPALPAAPAPQRQGWDGGHRRPRSLFQHDGWWYLLYEGTNINRKSTVQPGCWGDTIGLMRARALEGPWDNRHPAQIAIPPRAGDVFDSTWTGWPRAHVDAARGAVHVLYSAGGNDFKNDSLHDYASTGLRTLSLAELGLWRL